MRAIATLYCFPELAWAADAWWSGLARHWKDAGLRDVPDAPEELGDVHALWLAPDLFFAQTCGYPLTHRLKGEVTLVATPCYDAPGCEGAEYRSLVIVPDDSEFETLADLGGKIAAINSYDSQSGWNVLRHALAAALRSPASFPRIVETGAHRKSVAAVREGQADVAAIDCVTFALLRQAAPEEVEGLRVIAATARAPALPFITRRGIAGDELQRLRAGLMAALADPELKEPRRALLISGAKVLPESAYDRIIEIEMEGERRLASIGGAA